MSVKVTSTLVFYVNGKKVEDKTVDPEWTLLYYLRNKLKLCGTKLGCAEGGCGACTVMVSKFDRTKQTITHLPVNACLARVCSMHGCAVTTVEGIGSTKTRLHPVQERIAKSHGSQCGFCTPGIVMSMYTLLRTLPKPSMKDLEVAMQGNLCRCTGYRGIIEGYKTFTEDWELLQNGHRLTNGHGNVNSNVELNGNGTSCSLGKNCCRNQNGTKEEEGDKEVLFDKSEFVPYDSSQEPIFPPELTLHSDKFDGEKLYFKGEQVEWYRPTTLEEILQLKDAHPDAKIIVGNSEVGVEVKFKHFVYPVLIDPQRVSDMVTVTETDNGVKIGASVTLMDMEKALRERIKTLPKERTKIFVQIVEMLHWFAGKQIRSVASIGGNIMTGSPISDMNPILMSAQVQFELKSLKRGARYVPMNENFFTGYRRNVVEKDELLVSITIPYTDENQHFLAYKQARRRDDDIAIVNSAINIRFKDFKAKPLRLDWVNIAFGGMAPTTVTALKTREALRNKPWNEETLELAYKSLLDDLPLAPGAPGGMIQYRRSLTLSFFFRAFLAISKELGMRFPEIKINPRDLSGVEGFHNKVPKSSQYFQIVPNSQKKIDTIGRPVMHVAATKQVTGEAVYCDDIPRFDDELYMAFVNSSKAHAKILNIDATEALKVKGVHAFFSAKDMRDEHNRFGPIFHDEEIFAEEIVRTQGQTIGIVLAEDQLIAQKAARLVKVEYEDLKPLILSIDDAIKHGSFYEICRGLDKGDVDKAFAESAHVIEGDSRTGGQEQFYLETQCVVVVPKKEDSEMDVYSSSQHPSELNKLISEVLNIPQNRIVVKVKRMGGGFGGKESKGALLALPAAFAAKRLQRPVRIMLDRDEDMLKTGGRHPFYCKYKVGFDKDGQINGADVQIYNNGGFSYDLSTAVLERAVFHYENSYMIPNARVRGLVCKTNLPSNTAFRGFGGPQGMFCGENMIRHIAEYLNKDFVEVARRNLYKEGDFTHYHQQLEHCTLPRCWDECIESSQFHQRRRDIEIFNRNNRWKKRGISVVPVKFGIAFTVPHLNQTGAFAIVYTDGSVLLTHGGTEMGQGLHTKMIQIASRVLETSMDNIYITETATDKVPNTSATAASASSDLNGMAVMYACQTIKDRLEPVKKKYPNKTWPELIQQAYLERISLSATGFYATPNVGYDWINHAGTPFNYFTFGVAVSEVEIDCLTGDHQLLRTDIVMDLGESLNPAIDIGQVEGGFVQGYGLFVMEEMVYLNNGALFTRGPGAYKIPGFADIPLEFNVALLKGAPNPRAVYSSKAVGEPPLFLASSIFFAIKEAIKAARTEVGLTGFFKLDAPATSAKIRILCQDHIIDKLDQPEEGTFVPWNIIP